MRPWEDLPLSRIRKLGYAAGGIDAGKHHDTASLIGHPDLSASFSHAPCEFGDFRPYRSRIGEDDGLDRRDGFIRVQYVKVISSHSSPVTVSANCKTPRGGVWFHHLCKNFDETIFFGI